LDAIEGAVRNAVQLLWVTPGVMARFEDTGKIEPVLAAQLGLVGPAARACGLRRDVRKVHPTGIFRMVHLPLFARAYVRWLEIERSIEYVRNQLRELPRGPTLRDCPKAASGAFAVSLVEGWRGEICHVAITDEAGALTAYKIVDPSFHNWMGLAMALRNQQISDFPLCNKSFNLSYCGHDL
jgi:Ni,Fe-hydrogenase III large subunit